MIAAAAAKDMVAAGKPAAGGYRLAALRLTGAYWQARSGVDGGPQSPHVAWLSATPVGSQAGAGQSSRGV